MVTPQCTVHSGARAASFPFIRCLLTIYRAVRGQRARGAPLGCSQPRAPAPRARCSLHRPSCPLSSEHPRRSPRNSCACGRSLHISKLCMHAFHGTNNSAWTILFLYPAAQINLWFISQFESQNECFIWFNDQNKRSTTDVIIPQSHPIPEPALDNFRYL